MRRLREFEKPLSCSWGARPRTFRFVRNHVSGSRRAEERQIRGGTTHLFESFSSESTGLAPAANTMDAQSVNSLAVFPVILKGFCPTRWPTARSSWWCAQEAVLFDRVLLNIPDLVLWEHGSRPSM